MASPNLPLGLVNSPLVSGVFNVYAPNSIVTTQEALLTETSIDIFTENGSVLLIE